MAPGFKVVGPVAVLPLEAGGERYIYRSAAVLSAQGFTEAGIDHAAQAGLVERVELEDAPTVPTVEDGARVVVGKPIDDMTVDELKALAKEAGIDLGGKSSKADTLAAVKAAMKTAKAVPTQPAPDKD